VRHDLPFVIGSAPRGDDAIGETGLEGGRGPEVERVGRLDVVMPVDEDGGAIGNRPAAGEDDGMAGGAVDLGVKADAEEFLVKPLPAGGDIVPAGRVCGDAWEPEEIEQLGELGVHERQVN